MADRTTDDLVADCVKQRALTRLAACGACLHCLVERPNPTPEAIAHEAAGRSQRRRGPAASPLRRQAPPPPRSRPPALRPGEPARSSAEAARPQFADLDLRRCDRIAVLLSSGVRRQCRTVANSCASKRHAWFIIVSRSSSWVDGGDDPDVKSYQEFLHCRLLALAHLAADDDGREPRRLAQMFGRGSGELRHCGAAVEERLDRLLNFATRSGPIKDALLKLMHAGQCQSSFPRPR